MGGSLMSLVPHLRGDTLWWHHEGPWAQAGCREVIGWPHLGKEVADGAGWGGDRHPRLV